MSMHTREVYISDATYVPEGGKATEASGMSFDLKLTTVKFTFPEPLAKGKGTLKIKFQCTINNQVGGLRKENGRRIRTVALGVIPTITVTLPRRPASLDLPLKAAAVLVMMARVFRAWLSLGVPEAHMHRIKMRPLQVTVLDLSSVVGSTS